MKTFPPLRDILFLDIETVTTAADYDALDPRMQKAWEKKMQFTANEKNITPAELYTERAGIYAEFGKIIVIAAGIIHEKEEDEISLRVKNFSGVDEKDLLLDFKELVEKFNFNKLYLCAHNGKEFDFPYICRRMVVNGIPLPKALDLSGKKGWQVRHLDTMEMWKFGDRKNFTSIDVLAALFEVNSDESVKVEGSDVNEVYYIESDLPKIVKDCQQDVAILAQVYLKMNGLPAIPEENISFI